MLHIILSAFLSRLRGLLSSFHISIKLFDFKMANFLTKFIKKGVKRRSKSFFFWKLINLFLFYFIKNNNNIHSFFSSDERPSLLSFPALYSFSQSLHLQKLVQPIFDFEQEHVFLSHFDAKKRKKFVVKFLIRDIHKVPHKNGNW